VYSGALTGSGGLDVLGGITLTLTGSNTYFGATTISNATLSLSGYGALLNSATITVLKNSTLDSSALLMPPATVEAGQTLQGAGSVKGLSTISAGATLEPGPLAGTLTFSNSLAVNNGAMLNFALGTNGCRAAVIGNLTLGGTLNITDAGGFTTNTYTLFTYSGTLTYNGLAIENVPNWTYGYTISTNTPGQVSLVVSNTASSNPYVEWQLQFFHCTGCPQAQTNYDEDGTGQNNEFKYVAGLDPTNPASVFVLQIAGTTNQPIQTTLSYDPVATGRTYTVQFTTNLPAVTWAPLTSYEGPTTNGAQVSVTDSNATAPSRFYRVEISLP
jgi:hypothetical protein